MEKNREFLVSIISVTDFCPKSANLVQEQGISREFPEIAANPVSRQDLRSISRGCKKLAGN
jgi:hypothetical protein